MVVGTDGGPRAELPDLCGVPLLKPSRLTIGMGCPPDGRPARRDASLGPQLDALVDSSGNPDRASAVALIRRTGNAHRERLSWIDVGEHGEGGGAGDTVRRCMFCPHRFLNMQLPAVNPYVHVLDAALDLA